MMLNGYRHPFLVGTSYLGGIGDIPRTLVDLALSKLSAEIRKTDADWYSKYLDPEFREYWTQKALTQSWTVESGAGFHPMPLNIHQIYYVLDELEGYALLRDSNNQCHVSCFERIWETNSLLDSETECSLTDELTVLRARSLLLRPVEDDQVTRTLVDPFSGCFRYNKTLLSDSIRPPRTIPPPEKSEIYTISQKFALLPSEIHVTSTGDSANVDSQFLSYMNDLHPSHTKLYTILTRVFSRFLPLFEHTLTDLHRNNPLTGVRTHGYPHYTQWDEPEEPEHSDDEDGWREYESHMRSWVIHRPIRLPDVPSSGYPGGLEHRNIHVHLRNRTLKVIVRIEDICLTTSNPVCPRKPFHVEGMRNERVVATGLYFPTLKNITPSSIDFRMAVSFPRGFSAGDTGATMRGWGLGHGSPCNQGLGSIPIHQGLGVTLPNIYQYSLSSFRIADPVQVEGEMTVVSFLLIDPELPHKDVLTTAQVPPHHVSWMRQTLDQSLNPNIPHEILDKILEILIDDWVLDEAQNNALRSEAKEEREKFTRSSDTFHFSVPFDVWNGPET